MNVTEKPSRPCEIYLTSKQRKRRESVDNKVKLAFAKELAKKFKVEIAVASTELVSVGAAIGYAVGKRP